MYLFLNTLEKYVSSILNPKLSDTTIVYGEIKIDGTMVSGSVEKNKENTKKRCYTDTAKIEKVVYKWLKFGMLTINNEEPLKSFKH